MSELLGDPLLVGQRTLFVLTLILELVAVLGAARCRATFEPGDDGRTLWTLVTAFLGLRLVAELRLATLYFDLVPDAIASSEIASFVYVVVFRYLYTVSDLLVATALILAIRTYRSLGLHFRLERGDRAAIVALASLPLVAMSLRQELTGFLGTDDPSIVIYRLVAVTLASAIAMLCLIILRFVRQMGGGALARVWSAIAVAGLARAGSFVVLGLVAASSVRWGDLAEQTLLLLFALAWVFATRAQHRLQRLLPERPAAPGR